MSIASGPIASGPIAASDGGSGTPGGGTVRLPVIAADIWRLMAPVQAEAADAWTILPYDPIMVSADDRWRIGGPMAATILAAADYPTVLTRWSDGREFDASALSTSIDEGSWRWSLEADIAAYADWAAIRVGDVVSVAVGGEDFRFEVDGHQQQRQPGSESFSVTGRTPASGLDQGTTAITLAGMTASDAVSALCTAVGITTSWSTVNWMLPISAADTQQTPIELIQTIATAVGAVVELSPDGGTLTVRPIYPISPSQYGTATPAKTISLDVAFDLSDAFEARSGYDSIEIVDGAAAKSTTYQWIPLPNEGIARIIGLTIVPWRDDVLLLDSGEGNFSASYLGVVSEEVEDEIEIIDGKGRVSKPFHGLIGVNWKYRNLGTLTITEDGNIEAATASNTLAVVNYRSWQHRWRCSAGVPRIQVYISEPESGLSAGKITVARAPGTHPAPGVSDTWLSGMPAMLERGRNELDSQGVDRRNLSISLPLSEYPMALGAMIEVAESDREGAWRAKVTSISIYVEIGNIPTLTIGLERPI